MTMCSCYIANSCFNYLMFTYHGQELLTIKDLTEICCKIVDIRNPFKTFGKKSLIGSRGRQEANIKTGL